jgi:hypothetical protein
MYELLASTRRRVPLVRHNCPGDGCQVCESRIAAIEYEREHHDTPDYYDGT